MSQDTHRAVSEPPAQPGHLVDALLTANATFELRTTARPDFLFFTATLPSVERPYECDADELRALATMLADAADELELRRTMGNIAVGEGEPERVELKSEPLVPALTPVDELDLQPAGTA